MIAPAELVARDGGRYARVLGIDVRSSDAARFEWFLAALLYGTRISEALATRTWHTFVARGLTTPKRIVATGWDGLVACLDAGGYARYDYKTATKLLEVCDALLRDYGGSLDALHRAADGPDDLQARLKALGKGVGDTTVGIFLRELRGVWSKAAPRLSAPAITAAQSLGYLRRGTVNPERALLTLRARWRDAGQAAGDFPEFESALVREGLALRRRSRRHSAS